MIYMEYILLFGAMILVMWSQSKVKGKYEQYSRVAANTHYTGAQIASMILKRKGIYDVQVEMGQGLLSDHYDPKAKIVRLSPNVYNTNSIAAVSIAAHEVGHAIQHAENYGGIALRNTILPAAIVSGHLAWVAIFIGLFTFDAIFFAGIAMLGVIALFQTVTLPVEFNASSRALDLLSNMGILNSDEQSYAKDMLSAAAFTYVAALIATLAQIMRLLLLRGRRR
ncbi:MAG: peptidase [Firmicutes bacterium HGW-Firmicutes-10]|nr:MAG: peptidase [Firmicutes bacterium HGW-Firmicutes-10]